MKRYWKTAVLIPFIISCIGVYYIQAASDHDPVYILSTQKGSVEEAAPLSMELYLPKYGRVSVTSEGSRSENELLPWTKDDELYWFDSRLQSLSRVYRAFMRGKRDIRALYQDENRIAYAEIREIGKVEPDYRFTVSVYDKQREASHSFEAAVPQGSQYEYIIPIQVQMDGKTMKVVSRAVKKAKLQSGAVEEIHLFTIDLEQKAVLDDQTIVTSASPDQTSQLYIREITAVNPGEAEHNAVFLMLQSQEGQAGNALEASRSVVSQGLVVYNLWTGQKKVIQDELFSSEIVNGLEYQTVQMKYAKDELLLTVKQSPQELKVIRYSLAEGKVKQTFPVNVASVGDGKEEIRNNRLYILYDKKTGASSSPALNIVELDQGQTVYEGILMEKDDQGMLKQVTYQSSSVNGRINLE
ncbi:hypothetical protein [Paenibacillus sp. y28]|uniref:hypothetical protein n=1 Tax=Paenibacillus sp. y28 TaxID=3129110 RepID=UPI0030176F26